MTFLGVLALGFAVSLAVSGFMIPAGIGDVPDTRSNHKKVTPTGAGLGLIAALGAMALALPADGLDPAWPRLLSLIWAMAFLGFVDDLYILPPLLKFFIMTVIAALAVWVLGPVTSLPYGMTEYSLPYAAGFIGSVLWVFVVTNMVNFMDGSNGLMLTVMGIASAALGLIGLMYGARDVSYLPLMLAIGLLGIMPYNFRKKALIFSGDVGAITAGFIFAISVLWINQSVSSNLVYVGPVLLLPFLADGFLTMLMRARKGENLLAPHRSHLYQRLCAKGLSHPAVAVIYGVVTAVLAALTLWAINLNYQSFVSYLLIPVAALTALYFAVGRRLS